MVDKHLRVWFGVFVLAVFGAGMGAGSLLERYVRPAHTPMVPVGRLGPGGGPMGMASDGTAPAQVMHRMLGHLELTADQRQKLDAIFEKRRDRLERIRGDVRARFETEQHDLHDEIRQVLTAEQQKRFEQWLLAEPMPGMRHSSPGGRRGPASGPGRGGPGSGGRFNP